MKRIFRLTAIIAFLFISITTVQAQRRNARYNEYIKQYAPLAVEQMQRHKIPASITLAQGLLESGAGYSELARKSNNHFGIKCGGNWRGRTVRHDDDARNECFRAYRNPKDSYEDHSDFLKRGARYAFLFKLKITDYKGWARGLKKAGYATDPSYANRLITIIEDYELYKYDSRGMSKRDVRSWEKELKKKPWLANPHQVYIANDIAYVVARDGDTFQVLVSGTTGTTAARFSAPARPTSRRLGMDAAPRRNRSVRACSWARMASMPVSSSQVRAA